MMKLKKFSIGRLFYNNRFVLVFSIVASVILWIVLASSSSERQTRTITDVPVNLTLPESARQSDLKIFDGADAKVSVVIEGNRVAVGQVKSSDIDVTADTSGIISTGSNTLQLRASVKSSSLLNNYKITNIYPSIINVKVDRNRQKSFTIDDSGITFKVAQDYFASPVDFSPSTVTVSGPEGELSKVNSVVAEYELKNELKETQSFEPDIRLYDAYGIKIDNKNLTLSDTKVKATINVLRRQILPVTIEYLNKPSGLILTKDQITINPASLEIAAPEDILTNYKSISLDQLDFSTIDLSKNTFEQNVQLPPGCKNLSNAYTAKVTLNLAGFTKTDFDVTKFAFVHQSTTKNAAVLTKSIKVTLIGPQEEISKIKPEELQGVIDLTGKDFFTGNTQLPVTISITGADRTWAYGTYNANISVSDKTAG